MKDTAGTRREAMLSRLRAALADAPAGPEGAVDTTPRPVDADAATLLATFLANLDTAGVTHAVAGTPREARACLESFMRQRGVEHAAAWEAADLREAAGFDVHAALRDMGIRISVPQGERPCPDVATAQAGITGSVAALAATGTVVVTAGPGRPRSVSIVPPAHVAFVPVERLLPDLAAFLAALPPGTPPSAIHAISGVSSTGDIEFVYVRGAHGPMACHVIVTTFAPGRVPNMETSTG